MMLWTTGKAVSVMKRKRKRRKEQWCEQGQWKGTQALITPLRSCALEGQHHSRVIKLRAARRLCSGRYEVPPLRS